MTRVWLVVAVILAACSAEPIGSEGAAAPRGSLKKADVFGSCAGSDCAGAAQGGTCYCDDACTGYGDCCADKASLCEGKVTYATFNAGLAHGAVPFADERVAPITDMLARLDADVVCLEEVWTDDDANAILAGTGDAFPYHFRQVTQNDASEWLACGPTQWLDLYRLNSCVKDKCTPDGVSVFECVKDQCAPQYAQIDDTCKLCLAANPDSPAKCAAWKAPMYGSDGRNGLLLLSRRPIDNVTYTAYDTAVVKRGLIHAEISGQAIQCTHMSADLDMVPYPKGRRFSSWGEEHAAEVEMLKQQAGERCTLLIGDLNAGPASPGVTAELGGNYDEVVGAGYVDHNTHSPACTFCGDNPLVCSNPGRCGGYSSRIDHVLFHGCPDKMGATYSRFADDKIQVTDDQGVPHDARTSDHYGLKATVD
jgi:endonuclease/exonuclease/phosphatase family metal-dependent hydrolase